MSGKIAAHNREVIGSYDFNAHRMSPTSALGNNASGACAPLGYGCKKRCPTIDVSKFETGVLDLQESTHNRGTVFFCRKKKWSVAKPVSAQHIGAVTDQCIDSADAPLRDGFQ
ncbi:hypothetical protein O9K51_10708 [Purpureocillium lavendulum]|uniref:Uncharacterized protein n=1 Tax=Purpureocillium lavendulum TaxID=1247861 RepID=A0AB34FDK4_9HYPO|nr:hypothetical protein O9K51_10708 [Purpureocillium lavendulum]